MFCFIERTNHHFYQNLFPFKLGDSFCSLNNLFVEVCEPKTTNKLSSWLMCDFQNKREVNLRPFRNLSVTNQSIKPDRRNLVSLPITLPFQNNHQTKLTSYHQPYFDPTKIRVRFIGIVASSGIRAPLWRSICFRFISLTLSLLQILCFLGFYSVSVFSGFDFCFSIVYGIEFRVLCCFWVYFLVPHLFQDHLFLGLFFIFG